jgi:hypothetical protein
MELFFLEFKIVALYKKEDEKEKQNFGLEQMGDNCLGPFPVLLLLKVVSISIYQEFKICNQRIKLK